MTKLEQLQSLLANVRAGVWPEVSAKYFKPIDAALVYRAFYGDVNAVIALCKEVLPEWDWEIGSDGTAFVGLPGGRGFCVGNDTPSCAMLDCILQALIWQAEGK